MANNLETNNIVILTQALVRERVEARRNFPNAEFLPGDPVPYGQRVSRGSSAPGYVIGEIIRYLPVDEYNDPDCPGRVIHYPEKQPFHFWEIEIDTLVNGKKMKVLDYPPNLKPI